MNKLITIIVICTLFFSANLLGGNKDTLEVSTTIVSKHLWRSFDSGNAPCIEPFIKYSYGKFSLSGWGGYAVDGSYSEIDLFATYTVKSFSLSFLDYYCPPAKFKDTEFFDYTGKDSKHLMDVELKFNGTKKISVYALASTMVYGIDKDDKGNNQYSTYFEVGYSKKWKGKDLDFCVGLTPFKGMYADSFSVFNFGVTIKDKVKLTKEFKLPVKTSIVYNTEQEQLYFVFGITI